MPKHLTSVLLACVALIGGCETRRAVTLRVVDRDSGQPLAGAEVVRWHNDMVGLSFSAEKTIDEVQTTDEGGVVLFQRVGKYDHFYVNKAGFERALVHSFLRRPHFYSWPESRDLTRDLDGAYRVPLRPALPRAGEGSTQPAPPRQATQPRGP